jgi:hypothetical protein
MKTKGKIVAAALIGLLMAAGLVLAGCGPNCPGNGECVVTIGQGGSGLYVDNEAEKSSCGDQAQWDPTVGAAGDYTGGCNVQNAIAFSGGSYRKYGTIKCDC